VTLSRKHAKAVTIIWMWMDQRRDHTLFIQEVLRLQETEQRVHGLNMATFFGAFDELRNLASHLILHCEQSPASVLCTALTKRCVLSQSNLRAKKYQNTSEQRWNHVLQTNTTCRSSQLHTLIAKSAWLQLIPKSKSLPHTNPLTESNTTIS